MLNIELIFQTKMSNFDENPFAVSNNYIVISKLMLLLSGFLYTWCSKQRKKKSRSRIFFYEKLDNLKKKGEKFKSTMSTKKVFTKTLRVF